MTAFCLTVQDLHIAKLLMLLLYIIETVSFATHSTYKSEMIISIFTQF
jgi:hypothetical protein